MLSHKRETGEFGAVHCLLKHQRHGFNQRCCLTNPEKLLDQMSQTYPGCQFDLLQGELLPFIKHQQHQCLEKRHLQLLFALFFFRRKKLFLLNLLNKQQNQESVIYLFKLGFQNTMAQCRLPLKLPAAVFAQVECLEDLLQSHHLDDDNTVQR